MTALPFLAGDTDMKAHDSHKNQTGSSDLFHISVPWSDWGSHIWSFSCPFLYTRRYLDKG